MPQVTFHTGDGQARTVQGDDGQTILQIALDNGIPMESACGGNGFCTTCSCDIKDGEVALEEGRVSPVNDREENMGVEGPVRRLGCQCQVLGDVEVELVEV